MHDTLHVIVTILQSTFCLLPENTNRPLAFYDVCPLPTAWSGLLYKESERPIS